MRNATHPPGTEQHRELLADLTVHPADDVPGVGEEPGQPGDQHLHPGLLRGLPDGGCDGALADVDPSARQLPAATVAPADEEQPPVVPAHGDERRRHDGGRDRRRGIVEVHLPG